MQLKVTTIGNSTGIVLPREVLGRLKLEKGDTVHLIETPNGYELTAYDPSFAEEMAAAEGVMRTYRNALKELAK
ncbi:AbrB/MazE/SpoVT family DNA-binding domain-containing protein [Oleomonas cavernae]|uniref:AbrB/MazE/SpoVT family DNA-binding domain-containing protein n=1 Tax=Oleomonas cavernae TaxID=2320859 RepID=A0A418WJH3_9PROT|nr:AbrB/MazE/SpoVT family DNA-binding domain-containing protein [Oleomonas cavernae]